MIAAAVLRFVVAPALSRLPSNPDVTVQLEGSGTLLNVAALQSGDFANVVAKNAPLTAEQRIFVSEANSGSAVTHVDLTVRGPGGFTMESPHTYGVDRVTLEEAAAPGGAQVEQHDGITIGLPVDATTDGTYGYWDPTTKTAAPLRFTGTESLSGRTANNFIADPSGPLADETTLRSLPPGLPKVVVFALLGSLTPIQPQGAPALDPTALPEFVPFTYRAESQYDWSYDETLGTPLELSFRQQVIANFAANGQEIGLPLFDIAVRSTDASVRDAADTAGSNAWKLIAVRDVVPLLSFAASAWLAARLIRRLRALREHAIGFAETTLPALMRRAPEFHTLAPPDRRTLGLLVVSRLSARHGIAVTLTESMYLGVNAVVRIPFTLIEEAGGSGRSGSGGTPHRPRCPVGSPLHALPSERVVGEVLAGRRGNFLARRR